MKNIVVLRIVVALIGVAIIFLGLNVGLGGMRTLGWQSSRDFIEIIDASGFGIQDSHIRFIGGVWFSVGVLFLIGGFKLDLVRQTLVSLSLAIGIAGLFRLSALDASVLLSSAVAPSMVLEIIGFPALAWWLVRAGRRG